MGGNLANFQKKLHGQIKEIALGWGGGVFPVSPTNLPS